jgi:hypothetical protein
MIDILDNHFISICNWDKHQNIEGLEKIREQTRKRVAAHRERLKIEDGNATCNVTVTNDNALDIEEDKNKNNIYSNEFEQFWLLYPRKVDKKKALKSFKTALKAYPLSTILEGTEKYAKQVKNTDKQYIKHPATFLNNESF